MIFRDIRKQEIWNRLSTRSRRAMRKLKKRGGRPYEYKPRFDLCVNISEEFLITKEQAYLELLEMREIIENSGIL